jgi:TatA/E family protein of Tat protein translocase
MWGASDRGSPPESDPVVSKSGTEADRIVTRLALLPIGLRQYDEDMLGFGEMAFLFVLALLVFGPKKLPEIARQVGKALNEFKRASNEFRSQIESEIANLERETEPQILPPVEPPQGAVASGTLIDAAQVEHVPAQLTSQTDSTAKAPDA